MKAQPIVAHLRSLLFVVVTVWFAGCNLANAQSPYKVLPPAGIAVSKTDRDQLIASAGAVRAALDSLASSQDDAKDWRPDVEVFVRAVELAIEQNLFYRDEDVVAAQRTLDIASERMDAVADGTRGFTLMAIGSPSETSGRCLVGGFVSAIDASVQPYGLVLPTSFAEQDSRALRLDVWLHGRGETTTEVPFMMDRLEKVGPIDPADTMVLHPFGRHCNAFKFAGETDVLEAIDHVKTIGHVDDDRISIRGFSMGGAGVWHLAAHYPGHWFAANPGAGFVDTRVFQNLGGAMPFATGPWGEKLLAWYDIPPIVDNLFNTHVITYSGEMDSQRQAAELMVTASDQSMFLRQNKFEMTHVIGPGMGHEIDRESANTMDQRIAQWSVEVGKQPRTHVNFTTPTLKYNRVDWCFIEAMQSHWQPATIDASIENELKIFVKTKDVTAFRFDFGKSGWPMRSGYTEFTIDGQTLDGPAVTRGGDLNIRFEKLEDQWQEVSPDDRVESSLHKRSGLQGPIDDAFTKPFLFVLPSRPCRHGIVQRFVDRELIHASSTWRRVMRGNDPVVMDEDLTAEQIANFNLICFGDFRSNRYLAKIAAALPIQWTDDTLVIGDQRFDPSKHAAVMVYPNPQSPDRYVVVNSGITFRESSNANNANQIAMLPDWAIVDVSEVSDGVFPGKIVAADFFDESWQLKASK